MVGDARLAALRLERPLRARRARADAPSINFVTAHDGFTLHDLVSYERKHNEANREDNRDGAERQPQLELRRRGADRRRCTSDVCASGRSATCSPRCCFSQGVPMLLAGDEIGRTQRGNNNAYCQDNEISWLDWELDADAASC